ncbi:hypothetical protein D3C80_1266480 [compost metagenome]
MGLAFIQAEVPGRRQHFQPVADLHLLVHPVGNPATVDPLDRHLGPGIADWRAGHGVTTGQQLAVAGHAKAQELARLIGKPALEWLRNVEHQRAGIGRFIDYRADLQAVTAAG